MFRTLFKHFTPILSLMVSLSFLIAFFLCFFSLFSALSLVLLASLVPLFYLSRRQQLA